MDISSSKSVSESHQFLNMEKKKQKTIIGSIAEKWKLLKFLLYVRCLICHFKFQLSFKWCTKCQQFENK